MTNKFQKESISLHLKPFIEKNIEYKILFMAPDSGDIIYEPVVVKVESRQLTAVE